MNCAVARRMNKKFYDAIKVASTKLNEIAHYGSCKQYFLNETKECKIVKEKSLLARKNTRFYIAYQ